MRAILIALAFLVFPLLCWSVAFWSSVSAFTFGSSLSGLSLVRSIGNVSFGVVEAISADLWRMARDHRRGFRRTC